MASVNVLIVDDDPDHVLMLQRAIRKARPTIETRVANDGQKALIALADAPPHLMLLDLNMPVLDGFGVLEARQLDATLRAVPTVVVSTSDRDEDRERALDLGANEFVVKASYASLKATLHSLLIRYDDAG